jgi:hypothetical protein
VASCASDKPAASRARRSADAKCRTGGEAFTSGHNLSGRRSRSEPGVLADLAEQCHELDHHYDCQAIARLGEADERISDARRKRLHEIKTSAVDAAERAKAAALAAQESPED